MQFDRGFFSNLIRMNYMPSKIDLMVLAQQLKEL